MNYRAPDPHLVECYECGEPFETISYHKNIRCPECSKQNHVVRARSYNKTAHTGGLMKTVVVIGFDPAPGVNADEYDFAKNTRLDLLSFSMSVRDGYIPPGLVVKLRKGIFRVVGSYGKHCELETVA